MLQNWYADVKKSVLAVEPLWSQINNKTVDVIEQLYKQHDLIAY